MILLTTFPWNILLLSLIAAQGTEEVRRKRQKANIGTPSPWMLKHSALVAAGRTASASPKLITRGIRTPPNDEHRAGDRRRVSALLAIEPQWRLTNDMLDGAIRIPQFAARFRA